MSKQLELHPLINPDSAHYDNNEKSAIEELEETRTVNSLIGACDMNIFKYSYRKDHKGQKDADIKKTKTYHAYMTVLLHLQGLGFGEMKVSNAYRYTNIQWRYK